MAEIKFNKATRQKSKAAITIEGLSGRGKTGLALLIAAALTDNKWDKVFMIDTENKSSNLFVDLPCSNGDRFGHFNVAQLTEETGFKPTTYAAYKNAAKEAGAEVVIQDSITHAWQHKGGVLDLVAQLKLKNDRYAKDTYAAWGDATVVQEKNKLLELMRDSDVHIINTVRVKEKLEYTVDANGKPVLQSLGEQQIQQDNLKYEPDLVLHCLRAGSNKDGELIYPLVRCIKSRYAIFSPDQEYEITPTLLKQLKEYLDEGADPAVLNKQIKDELIKNIEEYIQKRPAAKTVLTELLKRAGATSPDLDKVPLTVLRAVYTQLKED